MINEQVMQDTILRLIEAGIDEPTIVSTLVDAGLTQEEALLELQKIKSIKSENTNPPLQQQSAPPEVAILRNQLDTQAEAHDLHQTITASTLNDHEEKIASIASQVEQVKANINAPQKTDSSLSYRISQLENKVDDISAQTKALLDVLQKVLENNRKILTNLEAEK